MLNSSTVLSKVEVFEQWDSCCGQWEVFSLQVCRRVWSPVPSPSAWLLGWHGQKHHTSRHWGPSVLENRTCMLVPEREAGAPSKTWPPPWVLRPCKYARTSVLISLQILYVVNQGCVEHLWFLNLAQSSAKSICEAGLGCVGCPGWLTRSVVNKLCLLLSLHAANTAVITELYFVDTWK